ncbi:MAG: ABC transporter ATP-binding protein [Rhodospirillales bacterium]|nr:ABC transporter ATP-binding protein [Rhodospirillales bacterium]
MSRGRSAGTDLALRNVTKRYGAVSALTDVSLAVEAGELLTILGPSGSGKTTLLKVVAGFELPEAGIVMLGGSDVTERPPAARNIGMVFQNYALFPHMTVRENVAFPLEMRRVPRRLIEEKVARALALVELTGYEARLPTQLSGGQQQRVALARAIVFDPILLLLDEPFGALDRKLREQMQLEVRRLQRQLGLTTLFITHDQEEALVLSDRIAVMSHGRIEQIGAPDEIYERPANGFVADFVGESNVIAGRAAARKDGLVEIELEDGARICVAGDRIPDAGAEVRVLVRPERLELASDGAAINRVAGTVVETVYLGTSYKYRLRVPGGREWLVRRPVRAGEAPLAPGDSVAVGFAPGDAHLIAG